VGLILAGVLARYFTPEEFGLWSILISLNGIILSGFDLGFGNALRNKMAQLYTYRYDEESKTYFFSIFYWFVLSAILLTLLFYSVKPFIPWGIIFKTTNHAIVENGASLIIMGSSIFALNIAFNLYTAGFFSYQESHWNAVLNGLSKIALLAFNLLFVVLLQSFFAINLMTFLVTLFSSVVAFIAFLVVRKWQFIIVPFKTAWAKVKELWLKSAQFALLQIFSTILLTVDYFVVSSISGLDIVGEYFIVKRIYLVLASFHFAILLPIWSAYTESIESRDVLWAEKLLKKTALYTVIIFVLGVTAMYFVGNYIIFLWTGKEITNMALFIWLGVWGFVYGWCNCFSVFLNATGYLKKQVILVGLAAVVFIPLSLLLGEKYGVLGICYSLILVGLPVAISNPVESITIIKNYQTNTVHKNSQL
jgi:O-antigen/teichoic acid export membrane protein